MEKPTSHKELRELEDHREERYDKALDELFEGKGSPEYAHYRWVKLKRVKKARKRKT